MAGEYVLWYDARSTACRRALELLRSRGVEPVLRRHLEEPPSAGEIRALLLRLGLPAHAVVRRDEDEYQALRLSDRTPEPELIDAIAVHPRILERPILATADRAVVGKPPEQVLSLLPPEGSGA